MDDLFVDTSGWATWCSSHERFHAVAVESVQRVWDKGGKLVTTSYVLAELTGLFNRIRIPRANQFEIIDSLRRDPSVEIVQIEPHWLNSAWKLWHARPDKDWSLVDCASFVVMETRKITGALTSDHHFEQAGFAPLLK